MELIQEHIKDGGDSEVGHVGGVVVAEEGVGLAGYVEKEDSLVGEGLEEVDDEGVVLEEGLEHVVHDDEEVDAGLDLLLLLVPDFGLADLRLEEHVGDGGLLVDHEVLEVWDVQGRRRVVLEHLLLRQGLQLVVLQVVRDRLQRRGQPELVHLPQMHEVRVVVVVRRGVDVLQWLLFHLPQVVPLLHLSDRSIVAQLRPQVLQVLRQLQDVHVLVLVRVQLPRRLLVLLSQQTDQVDVLVELLLRRLLLLHQLLPALLQHVQSLVVQVPQRQPIYLDFLRCVVHP